MVGGWISGLPGPRCLPSAFSSHMAFQAKEKTQIDVVMEALFSFNVKFSNASFIFSYFLGAY